MNDLTPRQLELLQIIHRFIKLGSSPTYTDLLKELKVRSTQTVRDILHPLEKKGYVNRKPNIARGIFLTFKAYRILEPNMTKNLNLQNQNYQGVINTSDTSSLYPEKQEIFTDTSVLKSLPQQDVSSQKWIVTEAVWKESQRKGIALNISGTSIISVPSSLEEMKLLHKDDKNAVYQYGFNSNILYAFKPVILNKKLQCGHNATTFFQYEGQTFYICGGVENDKADFSNIVAGILYYPQYVLQVNDKCIGWSLAELNSFNRHYKKYWVSITPKYLKINSSNQL